MFRARSLIAWFFMCSFFLAFASCDDNSMDTEKTAEALGNRLTDALNFANSDVIKGEKPTGLSDPTTAPQISQVSLPSRSELGDSFTVSILTDSQLAQSVDGAIVYVQHATKYLKVTAGLASLPGAEGQGTSIMYLEGTLAKDDFIKGQAFALEIALKTSDDIVGAYQTQGYFVEDDDKKLDLMSAAADYAYVVSSCFDDGSLSDSSQLVLSYIPSFDVYMNSNSFYGEFYHNLLTCIQSVTSCEAAAACSNDSYGEKVVGVCEESSFTDSCNGSVSTSCDSDEGYAIEFDCAKVEDGQTCYVNSYGEATCGSGTCESENYSSYCEGSDIVECDGGVMSSFDCSDLGMNCYLDNEGDAECGMGDGCTESNCDGSTIRDCDYGVLFEYDCTRLDKDFICMAVYDDEEEGMRYGCGMESGSEECKAGDTKTEEGRVSEVCIGGKYFKTYNRLEDTSSSLESSTDNVSESSEPQERDTDI